jgi:primosomal protein N' (replication factor Y)
MEIKKIYPQAKILRLDLETPLHDKKIADFEIIIGTQYAFDYIKWQEINLIGVLNADTLLYLPDYRSAEKTFNLLVKLAILLADPQKELLIQTFRPENYIFQAIKSVDYRLFYKNELEERKALFYPPLGRLIKLIYQSIEFNGGQNEVNKIYNELKTKINADKIVVNSPLLAYTQQVRGRWRWQIILKILDEKLSLAFLNNLPEDVIIDPEPESLL